MPKENLSVVIVAKNEEEAIVDCLKSVKGWTGELKEIFEVIRVSDTEIFKNLRLLIIVNFYKGCSLDG